MSTPPEFIQRCITELSELNTKTAALGAFKTTDTYKALPPRERSLLGMQSRAMNDYARALKARINLYMGD